MIRWCTLFLPIAAAFFLAGCEQVYSGYCGTSKEKISCLKPMDNESALLLQRFLPGYESSECHYTFQVRHYEVASCSNPSAKALGSDIDGYVRAEVFYGGGCYYRAQLDYKSGKWEDVLDELAGKMERELMLP